MEYTALLVIGLLLAAASIPSLKCDISLIHWYNRRRVSEEDAPRYGKGSNRHHCRGIYYGLRAIQI